MFIILQMLWKRKLLCKKVIAPLAQYLITSMLAAVITAKYAPFGGWISHVQLILTHSDADLMMRMFTLWNSIEVKVT